MNHKQDDQSDVVDVSLMEKFIDVQTQELVLREKEWELDKQKDNHQYELANKSIDAQVKDIERQREHHRSTQKIYYLLIGFVLLIISAFCVLLIFKNQVELIKKLFELFFFFLGGGASGYAYAYHKLSKRK